MQRGGRQAAVADARARLRPRARVVRAARLPRHACSPASTCRRCRCFPRIERSRKAVEAERVHPADLWAVDWRWREVANDPAVVPRQADPTVRAEFEGHLLALCAARRRSPRRRGSARFVPASAPARCIRRCARSGTSPRRCSRRSNHRAGRLRRLHQAGRLAPASAAFGCSSAATPTSPSGLNAALGSGQCVHGLFTNHGSGQRWHRWLLAGGGGVRAGSSAGIGPLDSARRRPRCVAIASSASWVRRLARRSRAAGKRAARRVSQIVVRADLQWRNGRPIGSERGPCRRRLW